MVNFSVLKYVAKAYIFHLIVWIKMEKISIQIILFHLLE